MKAEVSVPPKNRAKKSDFGEKIGFRVAWGFPLSCTRANGNVIKENNEGSS
jgi:hypothetical protein